MIFFFKELSSETKLLAFLLIVSIFSPYLLGSLQNTPSSTFFLLKGNSLGQKELKSEICLRGMNSIFKKKIEKKFVITSIANQLVGNNFEGIGEFELISSRVSLLGPRTCKFISKDSQGLRSFKVILERGDHPFIYKIADINESRGKL
jgi:hypothetical protein